MIQPDGTAHADTDLHEEGITPMPVSALLQGFDTFAGSGRSTALTGNLGPGTSVNQIEYTICSTTETLFQAVGLSASLAASSLFASVDVKAGFVSEIKAGATSVSIVVHARRATAQALTNAALIGGPPTNLAAFYRGFGDSFVSQLTTGAEYLAIYTFYAEDTEEQLAVEASLEAAGLLGGSVDAGLQSKLKTAQRNSTVRTQLRQRMFGVDGVPYPDTDSIIKFALNFPTLPAGNPVVLSFGTTGYENVPGMPSMSNIVNNRTAYTGSAGTMGVSEQILQLDEVDQQCRAINATYLAHGYTGDEGFATKWAQNGSDRRTADAWMRNMEADPTQSVEPPPLTSLDNGFPSISVDRKVGPKWGPDYVAATPFNDIPFGNVALEYTVRGITLYGDDTVEGITVSYANPNGSSNETHGSTQAASGTLNLAPGELITSVSGVKLDTPGRELCTLTFKTTLGQTFKWPPQWTWQNFSWTVPDGQTLVGFQGTTTSHLIQLQAVTISFMPAIWTEFPPARAQ